VKSILGGGFWTSYAWGELEGKEGRDGGGGTFSGAVLPNVKKKCSQNSVSDMKDQGSRERKGKEKRESPSCAGSFITVHIG